MVSVYFLPLAWIALVTQTVGTADVNVVGVSIDSSGDIKDDLKSMMRKDTSGVEDQRAVPYVTAVDRPDLKFSFVADETTVGQELIGQENVDYAAYAKALLPECARQCLKTFGCERFSWGDGDGDGCRVSMGKDMPFDAQADTQDDTQKVLRARDELVTQCAHGVAKEGSKTMVYTIIFFHAMPCGGACTKQFEDINAKMKKTLTPIQCAHACKNRPGCKYFRAGPNAANAAEGCRISNSTDASPRQCEFSATPSSTRYYVDR